MVLQVLIVDYKLVFPSGMATAVLINGFHTQGDDMAKYFLFLFFNPLLFKLDIYNNNNNMSNS